MARLASHVEGGVAAAFFGDVHALIVAIEAEVLALLSRRWFQQLILVVGSMRVVTLNAVAHCGRMNRSFERCCVLVGVAAEAERLRSRRDQLYARNIFVDPHLMAAQTARRDGGMDELAFRLILVALEALFRVDVLL